VNYLLDTCVLSEFTRRKPDPKVIDWVDHMEEEKLFLSVISLGEIQRGIERLPESHRKTELLAWVNDELVGRFGARLVPLEAATMLIWGTLTARLEAAGQPRPVMDTLIAASALRHNLIVATRNVADFAPCGTQVINPWE
jgi:toxin FitB